MRGRRLWIKAEGQTGPLKIYVTKKEIDIEGVRCKASFDPEKDEIEVAATTGEQAMKRSLLHELLHKCFAGASGDLREKILGDKTPEARSEREELIVSYLEPILYDLLTRNGWLRIPKPPSFK